MLKLTLYEDENRTIYVRASFIQSILRGLADKGTFIKLANGEHWVCELPEQIMAMPEMQKVTLASLPPSGMRYSDHGMGGWVKSGINGCVSQHCPNWRG